MKRAHSPARSQRTPGRGPADDAAGEELRRALEDRPPPGMDSIRYPTYRKYMVMSRVIELLNVRHKRNIFQYMRDLVLGDAEGGSNHTFIPAYGMTLGEFSLFQLMPSG